MCDRVGIIEIGRLIAVGSVDEIHRGDRPTGADARTDIKLRLLGELNGIIEWLQQRPDVHDLRLDGEFVRLALDGDRAQQAELLRELIAAGFNVSDFGGHAKSLEEVFLHVTRGVVQ
jgi:ABC-2 type transport system ATP-binding protein